MGKDDVISDRSSDNTEGEYVIIKVNLKTLSSGISYEML
jgi:hypothetical protein